jgi:hypothetical protein
MCNLAEQRVTYIRPSSLRTKGRLDVLFDDDDDDNDDDERTLAHFTTSETSWQHPVKFNFRSTLVNLTSINGHRNAHCIQAVATLVYKWPRFATIRQMTTRLVLLTDRQVRPKQ